MPRQIAKYGELWPFSTAALESRGARIKRIRNVSWRPYVGGAFDRKSDRRGRVAIFKQTYKSSPTLQVLRIISAQEEMFHNGKGRGAARQKQTGRFKKVKIETDSTASYETDPFKSLTSFLSNANAQAGAGGD